MKVISFLSQKGGVGKSTLSRAVACEAHKSGLLVKLADMDTQQGTSSEWHRERLNNGKEPIGSVEVFSTAANLLKSTNNSDLLVVDGAPRASAGTLEIAKISDLVVLPTCSSRDDLVPAVKLAYELIKNNIPKKNIAFALSRVTTEAEIQEAREFIEQAGFTVLEGCLYEKTAYRQAQDSGLSVTETRYKTLNIKADTILESIIEYIAGE
jgi:chromosome partitioning protein